MKIGRSILISLAAGCGASDSTDTGRAPLPPIGESDPSANRSDENADTGCPLALPAAQVASEVTSDGVALVFTTAGGDPAELRSRVHRMADSHNAARVPGDEAAGAGGAEGGMTSPEGAHGVDLHGAARQVPSRAAVEDTASGARIVFVPSDPGQLPVLREQIRVHGKEMATTGCGEAEAPKPQAPPPGDSNLTPQPTPSPSPQDPILPDRPVTPDQPVTPPPPPPPPIGEPYVQ